MSIIAVQVFKDSIVVGADSRVTKGSTIQENQGKIFQFESFGTWLCVAGVGSSEDIGLFVRYLNSVVMLNEEGVSEKQDIENVANAFMLYIQDKLKIKKQDYTASFFLIYDKKPYYVQDFLVEEVKHYEAAGSGRDAALGVLSLGDKTMKEVIEAACKVNVYCGLPAEVVHLNKI